MPEGDTIHYAANRIRPAARGARAGGDPHTAGAPRMDHWPERLSGRTVESVEARGKHLLLRFDGGLTIHSHLRMSGILGGLCQRAPAGGGPLRRAWLVIRVGAAEIVEFDGPVLELLNEARVRVDPRLTGLGQDVIGAVLRRAAVPAQAARRRSDPADRGRAARPADAGGDRQPVEGRELLRRRLDPWRATAEVSDEEVLAAVALRPRADGQLGRRWVHGRPRAVYRRAGMPCPRCGRR